MAFLVAPLEAFLGGMLKDKRGIGVADGEAMYIYESRDPEDGFNVQKLLK